MAKFRKYMLFDFNLPAGKAQGNSLHLAVLTNNLKIIAPLLESSEKIDCLYYDNDGRKPKDLCPYNSPVYKILQQYELKIMKNIYDDITYTQKDKVIIREIPITHSVLNIRN